MRGYAVRLDKIEKDLPEPDGRCDECRSRPYYAWVESRALAPAPPTTELISDMGEEEDVPSERVGDWSGTEPCAVCGWKPFVIDVRMPFGYDREIDHADIRPDDED